MYEIDVDQLGEMMAHGKGVGRMWRMDRLIWIIYNYCVIWFWKISNGMCIECTVVVNNMVVFCLVIVKQINLMCVRVDSIRIKRIYK